MESSSEEEGEIPRQILVEDRDARQSWVAVTEIERELVEQAVQALAPLPVPESGVDVLYKPDKLAISKLMGMRVKRRLIVYRIHYLGTDEMWLGDDVSSFIPRRIVVFPVHNGTEPAPMQLPLDMRQEKTLAALPDDVLAATDVAELDKQAGVIWVQGYAPNTWEELTGEARTAVVHALVASRAMQVDYTQKTQHLVTLKKSKGNASFQVLRDKRYGLWLADVFKGHGRPVSYRRVVVAGEHHPVPK